MERISNFLKREQQQKIQSKLPPHFAQQVLNLELEIQSNSILDIQIVNRLVELYSVHDYSIQIAVEYYESIQINLLLKPTVNHVIQTSSKQNMIFGTELTPNRNQNQIRKKELQNNITFAIQNSEGQVKSIIKNANDRYENITKFINTGIQRQQNNLRQRIKSRKYNKSEKSVRDPKQEEPNQIVQIQQIKPFTIDHSTIETKQDETLKQHSQKIQKKQSVEISNIQTNKQINMINVDEQVIVEPKKQSKIQSKKQLQSIKQCKQIEISIQQQKKKREQRKKNRQKRKVLTLKENQQKEELPQQYQIPF